MNRTITLPLGCLAVCLAALFTCGCAADPDDEAPDVWYDEETARCYTEDDAGEPVEAPCDGPSVTALDIPPYCDTPEDCTRVTDSPP